MPMLEPKKPTIFRWMLDALMLIGIVPVLAMLVFCVMVSYKIYHPPRKHKRRPVNTGMTYDAVTIPTSEGLNLAALLAIPANPKACVIVCHEWGSHKATKLKYAEFLYEAGYATALFDLRNHGDSDADPAWGDMSRRYTDDLQATVEYLRRHPRLGALSVIALSFSFSTFPAMHCLAHRPSARLDGLILDSGPSLNEREIAMNFLRSIGRMYFPAWLRGPLMFPMSAHIVEKLISHFLHVDWPPQLENLHAPMLFICGADDEVAPVEAMRPLSERIPYAEFWLVPASPHLLAFKIEPEAYRRRVLAFLDGICIESKRA